MTYYPTIGATSKPFTPLKPGTFICDRCGILTDDRRNQTTCQDCRDIENPPRTTLIRDMWHDGYTLDDIKARLDVKMSVVTSALRANK